MYDSNVKLNEGIFLSSNMSGGDAYNTEDYNGNAVKKIVDRDKLSDKQEIYASLFMNCSSNSALSDKCDLAVDESSVFTQSTGFETNSPELPPPDAYPRGLKYTLENNEGYTKEHKLEEFLNSAKAKEINEKITDPTLKLNW